MELYFFNIKLFYGTKLLFLLTSFFFSSAQTAQEKEGEISMLRYFFANLAWSGNRRIEPWSRQLLLIGCTKIEYKTEKITGICMILF